ncbi:MAG TPA: N-6 DNA methylase [Thermoanaerobaculia bacterium]|jgi:type I restriction enzyme M protein|nr:N-6 DNA methylase [Thermoanaerobaculia bacterium]
MALKKSELYSSLWQSCDELRGGMDASQYKDYVLVLLFVKYVSDKYAGQPFAPIKVPKGASFKDMIALKGKTDLGDQINKKILAPLATENKLSDMPDFNDATKLGSGKEMVERLTNLIAIFENRALDFSKNRADGDDILGDAYEYLMRHFATESGKSKGQFYTPAEVSRVIAKIVGIGSAKTTSQTSVYDPTCGSGSLLLKVGDEAHSQVTLYGQEKDSATSGLARMNMILHNYPTADIKLGNTLTTPHFKDGSGQLKLFDYVVANPPFSDKRWSTGLDPEKDVFERFKSYGVPPAKQGDYAYLLHIVRSLKSNGKGACILPHGVLFRGNAEGVIRKNLIQRGLILGIIGLPANLFYGTGIPACVVILDKENAAGRKSLFLVDASKGFLKDGPKNRLREQDIHMIVDTFTRQVEIPGYSRRVPVMEIADPKNDYNLNLPRYIDSSEPEDLQDIDGHLRGGIPNRDLDALDRYWQIIPGVRAALFKRADRAGYSRLRVASGDIKATIFDHPEFSAFNASATKLFTKWRAANRPLLEGIGNDTRPKALIDELSEGLLSAFAKARLIDPYDVYQHLMDIWADSMQDDVYAIVADGWRKAAKLRIIIHEKVEKKDKDKSKEKPKEKPDFIAGKVKYKAELIPIELVIARYFAKAQSDIEVLEAQLAEIQQKLEELEEEHTGEGGLLEEARNEKDKLTKASSAARLKEIKEEPDADEEREVLEEYLRVIAEEGRVAVRLDEADGALMTKLVAKYGQLTEDEIKVLVVEEKWLAAVAAAVQGELDRVSRTLTQRARELSARYATPLPALIDEVAALAARVDGHLARMGASWK